MPRRLQGPLLRRLEVQKWILLMDPRMLLSKLPFFILSEPILIQTVGVVEVKDTHVLKEMAAVQGMSLH